MRPHSMLLAFILTLTQVCHCYPSFAALSFVERNEPPLAKLNVTERSNIDPFPWEGVPLGGVRAPCPGLNTLANHGYINRNGSNITTSMLQAAFLNAFNVGPGVISPGANTALSICSKATNTSCKQFQLDQLNTPHVLEHDGSLTRDDFQMKFNLTADNHSFNGTIWNMTKALYGDVTHVDITLANVVRLSRMNQARSDDAPGWFLLAGVTSKIENAFFLSVMNDPTRGRNVSDPLARLEWMDYWFSHERLPTDIGWVRPTSLITNNLMTNLAIAIGAAPRTFPITITSTATTNDPASIPDMSSTSSASDITSTSDVPSTIDVPSTSDVPSISDASTTSFATSTAFPFPFTSLPTPDPTASSGAAKNRRQNPAAHAPIPMAAIPALQAQPAAAKKIAIAAAMASAAAPAPPSVPNWYVQALSPRQLRDIERESADYVARVQAAFGADLAGIL